VEPFSAGNGHEIKILRPEFRITGVVDSVAGFVEAYIRTVLL